MYVCSQQDVQFVDATLKFNYPFYYGFFRENLLFIADTYFKYS